MKSRLVGAVLAIVLPASAAQWQLALPGYQYNFPRDYFNHPNYQTEWWYYTGNLRASDGHRFGFELTFFRESMDLPKTLEISSGVWRPDQIYLAHLALSDLDGGEFYYTERLNRAGPGLAGADLNEHRYWNGNWQVVWHSLETGKQELQAISDRLTLRIRLVPAKPVVIHGDNGISQKGPERGEASHYLSFTRLSAAGELEWKGKSFAVNGLAWMDHEFFTAQLDKDLTGWDWFAIQLNNNEELMLYRLRVNGCGANECSSPYSSGTFVDARGHAHQLDASQFRLSPGREWCSGASGARYPITWKISVPSLKLELFESTPLNNQELFSSNAITPTYWEGAVTYQGQRDGQLVQGRGYLEMTGYDHHALDRGER